ncbi:MAG: sulfatase-like hydrolase/transferase, partial [Pirellulaceae bacterium]|nr:sulfatase-like hydrolase/transferase [Pirellulaceae bacterium]
TPDDKIGGKAVTGASRNVSGNPMAAWKSPKRKSQAGTQDLRHDFIHENDVVLGRLIDYLQQTDDPRRPGHPLIDNTIVIFTSDNGAERNADYATGPFRSAKGSVYEGGHRVPFIVAWPQGDVGDGDASTTGETNDTLIALQDLYATLSEAVNVALPDLRDREKGGEDSTSVLAAWRGDSIARGPIFHNDHNEAEDHAAVALRSDHPTDEHGRKYPGKWKLFFDAQLLRFGVAQPTELYDLVTDPLEQEDRMGESELRSLVTTMTRQALLHRNSGGHRYVAIAPADRLTLLWTPGTTKPVDDQHRFVDLREQTLSAASMDARLIVAANQGSLNVRLTAMRGKDIIEGQEFHLNERGLGVGGGEFGQVDGGEAIVLRFDQDVLVESVAIIAGHGHVGGFYRVAQSAPLAIYCVDDDIDAQDQSGLISDIGVLRAGQPLRLDSSPHYGVEASGRWRLGSITLRVLADDQ